MSRLRIVESKADFDSAMKEIAKQKWISYDLETSGLNPFAPGAYIASIGIGTKLHDFAFPMDHYKSKLFEDLKGQQRRASIIYDVIKDKNKAAQNGKFDSLFYKMIFDHWLWCDYDVMLAHYNIDENSRHGLKELAMKYLGADDYDIPLSDKQGRTGDLFTHCEYLGYDCHYVLQLKAIFIRAMLKEPSTHRLFSYLTMPLSRLYTKVEYRGVPIDESKLEDGRKYWEEISVSSDKELRRITKNYIPKPNKKGKIPELNFGSPQQLSELLFGYLKLKPLDKTPKGAYSTSESVLKRLEHPICKHILDNREANKNLSTFIESWKGRLDEHGRMHPTFKIHGTVTGRPSCEEPNLQQTPRDPRIRAIIDAPKGWSLVEADYSQAELRIAADLANEPTLMKIYQTEGDVHTLTVQRIFGIMEPTSEQRKKGKAINFGFLYGMWWKKFKEYARDNYGQSFSDKESESVRKKFFELYSALPDWHKKQKKLARSQGYVINKIGRKRRLPDAQRPNTGEYDRLQGEAERQAINSPVQSLASDINLIAAIEIDRTINNEYCQIVGTVHDSNLFLIRNDKLDECVREIKSIMESPIVLNDVFKVKLKVPLVADVKVGAWSKGVPYDFKKSKKRYG